MREVHQLRDVKSWMDSGIKLSTPSNEAAKHYDAAISQLVGWYDDKQFGGLEGSMKKMLDADPAFIGGRSLTYAFEAIGGSKVNNNPALKRNIEQLALDVECSSNCDQYEKLHVKALQFVSTNDFDLAIRQWEELLIDYPSDVLSLHLAGLVCLSSGRLERIGDISGRILPSFRDEYSLGSVHAWHSFGLSEINLFSQAEKQARIGLSMDPKNGWLTHALAHVFEMNSRYNDGIAYMGQCEPLLNVSNHIAGHNYWHWSLYYLTKGDFDATLDILEQKLLCRPGFDSLSLSYLLSMENTVIGNNVLPKHGDHIEKIVEPYRKQHYRSFIDMHVMMGLCASKKYDEAEQFMAESINTEDLQGKNVNENLLKSILSYSREKYEDCVALLWPIRMLINATLRSNKI